MSHPPVSMMQDPLQCAADAEDAVGSSTGIPAGSALPSGRTEAADTSTASCSPATTKATSTPSSSHRPDLFKIATCFRFCFVTYLIGQRTNRDKKERAGAPDFLMSVSS